MSGLHIPAEDGLHLRLVQPCSYLGLSAILTAAYPALSELFHPQQLTDGDVE